MCLTTLFCVLLCLRMTAAIHIFTAIYSISSLLSLLFTRFSSSSCQSDFSCCFSFLSSQQPEVLVFAVHLAVGTYSESLLSLDVLKALIWCLGQIHWYLQCFVAFSSLSYFCQKRVFGVREIHSFHKLFFFFLFREGGWGGVGWG